MTEKINARLADLGNIIMRHEKITIAGHVNPDGDAIGSCLALAMFLKNKGKDVNVLLEDYNERYHIINGSELLYKGDLGQLMPDIFIALDCGDKKRLGEFGSVFERAEKTIVIDHHISNDYYGAYNYVNAQVSSTCEIIYNLLGYMGDIDKGIAANLYAGIIFDTGGLRHSSTSVKTVEIVCSLMKQEIPFTEIYNEILFAKSLTEVKIFAKAIEQIKFVEGFPFAYTFISRQMLADAGASTKELDGIVEYIRSIRGIEVALFAYEPREGDMKLSLRSKSLNVSKIAQSLGGGGHKQAAGVSIRGQSGQVLEKIINIVKSELKVHGY